MNLNKKHIIIGIFVLFWIAVIAWGMFKTTGKLSQTKPASGVLEKLTARQGETTKDADEAEKKLPTAADTEVPLVLVRTLSVKAVDFRDVLPVMGSVKGKTEIELKFEINGVIKSIHFHEGERIKKGDVIAELDPKDAELKASYAKSKYNAALAAYNSGQKKLEVNKKLFEAGAIIKSKLEEVELEVESARYQAETAKSEMELAANELRKVYLYAIKDGVMGPREAEEGEFVTPQDKVGSLLEIGEVFVEVGVVERDIDKVKLGQKALVFVDSYPNTTFEGEVQYIYPVVEGKSRTLTVKINVPNPQGLLLPGMFSRAEIKIIELQNALIIPVTTLIYTKSGTILLPVIPKIAVKKHEDETETGVLKLRSVELGYKTSDYAQVLSGVSEGDLVVLETQGEVKLEDNVQVRIIGTEEISF